VREVKQRVDAGNVNNKKYIMPNPKVKNMPRKQQMAVKASMAEQSPGKMKQSPMLKKLSASCKAAARRKFDVYPSAYANMWASAQGRKGKC